MRKLRRIIVHCSATRPGWMQGTSARAKVDEIRRWHMEDRGWKDIGYHLVIDRDGSVAEGRPIWREGAHVPGQNADSIGVCLVGGHGSAATDRFDANFTLAQDRALRAQIRRLREDHGPLSLHGHNEFAAKACPGFDVETWFFGGFDHDG